MPGIATSNVVPSGFGVGNGDSDAKAGSLDRTGVRDPFDRERGTVVRGGALIQDRYE